MIERRPFASLGRVDNWGVMARHHFSFADYYDPKRVNWGVLRAWNDDEITPYTGFSPHSHTNVDIITYVREGAITHRDTNGNVGRTEAGDVHVLCAGSGVRHTEYNHESEAAKMFQIWIAPTRAGGDPASGTTFFPREDRSGRLTVLANGIANDDEALPLRADARVLGATLKAGDSLEYAIGENRHGYLVPATGAIAVNGVRIEARDGAAIANTETVTITALNNAEIILVDAA
jgi:redox-sensitive bicupin YhaK (pirin superfamily)